MGRFQRKTIVKLFLRPVACCAVALLSACAAFSPSLSKTDVPVAENAYLYGRFVMEAPKAYLSFAGHQTMGFALECASGQYILIKFKVDEPLQLLKVAPASKCTFREIVYTDAGGNIKSRKPAPPELAKEINFTPGRAHYMGDFFATTTTTTSGNMIYRNWEIKRMKDDYELSTEELKKAYPAFASLPMERRLLGR
jgi:hypothetical protein